MTADGLDKYFSDRFPRNGKIISMLLKDLCEQRKPEKMLFVRTSTTGRWLDLMDIPPEKEGSIVRMFYITKDNTPVLHENSHIVEQEGVAGFVDALEDEFDLICVDPYHEFDTSYRDLSVLTSVLSDDGILLCHDCAPETEMSASPQFTQGAWSGTTYAAFVKIASENPAWFFSILDTDTGIGIISKKPEWYLSQAFDQKKQIELCHLIELKKYDEAFNLFRTSGRDIIGLLGKDSSDNAGG